MSLPAPNLDDRRFQDLVDDAKRLVQQRCPGWTDHNVHDPGVTLIETFAYMTDQLLYRLNRVPGPRLRQVPRADRRAPVPADGGARPASRSGSPRRSTRTCSCPRRAEVATSRASGLEPVSFTTADELRIVSATRSRVASSIVEGEERDHTDALAGSNPPGFYPFDQVPKPGDSMLVGLTERGAVVRGAPAPRLRDRGRRRRPRGSAARLGGVDGRRLGRLRPRLGRHGRAQPRRRHRPARARGARVVADPEPARRLAALPGRSRRTRASPRTARRRASAAATPTRSAARPTPCMPRRSRASCSGSPRACPRSASRPIAARSCRATARACSRSAGPTAGRSGARSCTSPTPGPTDDHFVLDAAAGVVELGPAVRERDGSLTQHGSVPPKGSMLRLRSYRTRRRRGGQRRRAAG